MSSFLCELQCKAGKNLISEGCISHAPKTLYRDDKGVDFSRILEAEIQQNRRMWLCIIARRGRRQKKTQRLKAK